MNGKYFFRVGSTGILVCFLVLCSYPAIAGSGYSGGRGDNADPLFLQAPAAWVDSVMKTLTPEQRIAQMFMIAAYSDDRPENKQKVERLVRDYQVGGLVFFQGTPFRQVQLTNYYQSISKIPLLVAMDAEWGLAMRLDSTILYPRQMMLGAIQDDRQIFDMGVQIAQQLKRIGVQINFAPVCDINNNPDNPVINSRSFGEDRNNVARKALFYMKGMESQGILAVAKHFPGHGDTNTDSHLELPVVPYPRDRLDSMELFPFRELIREGIAGVMTAHLEIPALDARENTPSSLSDVVTDSLLRQQLGFKGLIFTDALNMKGITQYYNPVDAAVKALLAGNDILLMPDSIPGIITRVKDMINEGQISQSVIDDHCRRILAAKYYAGLNHYQPVATTDLQGDLHKPEYRLLQRKLTESGITVLQNTDGLIPLMRLDTLHIASVVFSQKRDTIFQKTIGLYAPVTCFRIGSSGIRNPDSLLQELRKYNLVIASIQSDDYRANRDYGVSEETFRFLDTLVTVRPVILDVLANPYLLRWFRHIDQCRSLIVSYENNPINQESSAMMIFGATGAGGVLPVTAGPWKSMVSGMQIAGTGRLKFTLPLEAGMNEDTLRRIDRIVADAIDKQAMPGCVILVAHNGKVVFDKAYGHQKYAYSKAVSPSDLYDLASVTKVIATTSAVMKMVDEGKVDVTRKLSVYLPYLKKTNKKDMIVRDVLLHRAGLVPFIQFYYNALEPVFKDQPLISKQQTDANCLLIGKDEYLNRYTRYKASIVSDHYSPEYSLHVADHMFMIKSWVDTIYDGIAKSPLGKKQYVYSDLGFMLLKQMVDTLTLQPFPRFIDSAYFKKLGAYRLVFNPLEHFPISQIAPTEDDQLFRKQQVQGYVHDPRAAMMGGVAGDAGLFGDAVDLAKVLQMLLNKGEYGGERYLKESTVDLFLHRPAGIKNNRRCLGWDMPEPDKSKPQPACPGASLNSFGHTGFTGNMVWVDPAYNLVYVFLSNRVYPDAENIRLALMNVRTNVQQVLYNALMDQNTNP